MNLRQVPKITLLSDWVSFRLALHGFVHRFLGVVIFWSTAASEEGPCYSALDFRKLRKTLLRLSAVWKLIAKPLWREQGWPFAFGKVGWISSVSCKLAQHRSQWTMRWISAQRNVASSNRRKQQKWQSRSEECWPPREQPAVSRSWTTSLAPHVLHCCETTPPTPSQQQHGIRQLKLPQLLFSRKVK